MSMGGVGGAKKKRLVDSCELFFFVEPLTSGKANRGLSQAQISVHHATGSELTSLRNGFFLWL